MNRWKEIRGYQKRAEQELKNKRQVEEVARKNEINYEFIMRCGDENFLGNLALVWWPVANLVLTEELLSFRARF